MFAMSVLICGCSHARQPRGRHAGLTRRPAYTGFGADETGIPDQEPHQIRYKCISRPARARAGPADGNEAGPAGRRERCGTGRRERGRACGTARAMRDRPTGTRTGRTDLRDGWPGARDAPATHPPGPAVLLPGGTARPPHPPQRTPPAQRCSCRGAHPAPHTPRNAPPRPSGALAGTPRPPHPPQRTPSAQQAGRRGCVRGELPRAGSRGGTASHSRQCTRSRAGGLGVGVAFWVRPGPAPALGGGLSKSLFGCCYLGLRGTT